MIGILEVSPNAKIIVCTIGQNLFVKILNLTSLEDQYNLNDSKIENHNTAFLPIYFDFDYFTPYSELQKTSVSQPPVEEKLPLLIDLPLDKR